MASSSQAKAAQQRWELENDIQVVSETDALFKYDHEASTVLQQQRPWSTDPHHFKHVKVSALALLKMAMHARSGGNNEVMGMLQGKIMGDTFVVMDSFALPVEGTETRVNAASEANEYMVQFADSQKVVNRKENVCGWYHSHPGYGCWLSGIDVGTQMTNQQWQEPFGGEGGDRRLPYYPEGYKPPDEPQSEYQTIPLNKIEDFGVHAKSYYSLDISYFKSSLDSHMLELLWNKYWVNTLSASPLLGNRDFLVGQIQDLGEKLEQAAGRRESTTDHVDSSKMAVEQVKGLASQVVKDLLFNYRPKLLQSGCTSDAAPMEM
eukprot:CAMPEP_0177751692 /NCGR_PEP_ID=MMETSP0491_2-20121128/511_1 /TAXON_ID=63592 /ORGANISM="Tetraselmis chuii, Strain PLY429" /LENGTH=319 /DNA_ID=CAMNT_0019266825 /DNA_START=119 /DNA_END=1080 /DNA_ORIENTATION=-